MADQNAVTHESYDGSVCKFCGAVMTCLSCGGAQPEESRSVQKRKAAMRGERPPMFECAAKEGQ